MFENQDEAVNALLEGSNEFKTLYNEHAQLKEKVRDAELGVLPLDDATLGTMKKQKLHHKDRMAAMIEEYRQATA